MHVLVINRQQTITNNTHTFPNNSLHSDVWGCMPSNIQNKMSAHIMFIDKSCKPFLFINMRWVSDRYRARGHRGRDRMIVEYMTIYAISAYQY